VVCTKATKNSSAITAAQPRGIHTQLPYSPKKFSAPKDISTTNVLNILLLFLLKKIETILTILV